MRRIRAIPRLPRRRRDDHKGRFGRVLVIGGSSGMIGAPALAANGALRSGAGLVTVACPASIQQSVAVLCPCATSLPLPERAGGLNPTGARTRLAAAGLLGGDAAPSVLAVGPGLGGGGAAFDRALFRLIDLFRNDLGLPVVLDADAINAMARTFGKASGRTGRGGGGGVAKRRPAGDGVMHRRTIITPHPGEMARLHGASAADVQRDREGIAVRTAQWMSAGVDDDEQGAIVVLKGAGTVVTDGRRLYVNRTGNPGMATGGSGDVLTGVIAGLVGQGLSLFDAAVLGVYIHGAAGDLARRCVGEAGLIATDLIEFLPAAIKRREAARA